MLTVSSRDFFLSIPQQSQSQSQAGLASVNCLLSVPPQPGALGAFRQTPWSRRLNRIQERALPMQAKESHSTKTGPLQFARSMNGGLHMASTHQRPVTFSFFPPRVNAGEKFKTGGRAMFWNANEHWTCYWTNAVCVLFKDMQRPYINCNRSGGVCVISTMSFVLIVHNPPIINLAACLVWLASMVAILSAN